MLNTFIFLPHYCMLHLLRLLHVCGTLVSIYDVFSFSVLFYREVSFGKKFSLCYQRKSRSFCYLQLYLTRWNLPTGLGE